jgi:hypothetical protein
VSGENIYGPFEAGFGTQQDSILESLGCAQGSLGHVSGGIDTRLAEQLVAFQCSVALPRTSSSGKYTSLLDQCGGHTQAYHFHERLSCLYKEEGKHSTEVGETPDNRSIYGKWEDHSTKTTPVLDACGGHFGTTPDSPTTPVYHYHVQDNPPFTIGCYGPAKNVDTGFEELVSLAMCRALYDGCGDGDEETLTTNAGSFPYDPWCPCFDKTGSNVVKSGADIGALQQIKETQQNVVSGNGGTSLAAGILSLSVTVLCSLASMLPPVWE